MTAAPRRVLGPAAQLPGRAALLLVLALAACSSPGGATSNGAAMPSTAVSSASAPALRVTSTLDGHTSLPLRIHWQAFPSAPDVDLPEVDFLIDGRLGWAQPNTPYFYGDDGNWLVTSFLTPGGARLHRTGDRQGRAHGHRHGAGVGHHTPGSCRRHVGAPSYRR